MQFQRILFFLAALCVATVSVSADEWETLFDGKTLEGWDGDPKTWSVKDGAITGTTYNEEDKKLKGNTFIIWRGGEVDNFELETVSEEIKHLQRSRAFSLFCTLQHPLVKLKQDINEI